MRSLKSWYYEAYHCYREARLMIESFLKGFGVEFCKIGWGDKINRLKLELEVIKDYIDTGSFSDAIWLSENIGSVLDEFFEEFQKKVNANKNNGGIDD